MSESLNCCVIHRPGYTDIKILHFVNAPSMAASGVMRQTEPDKRQRHIKIDAVSSKTRIQIRRLTMQFHSLLIAENFQRSASSRFRLRIRTLANVVGIVAIAGLSLSDALAASNEQENEHELQGSDRHRVCTRATLHGRYLFAASGVLLPPAFGVTAPTQAADAGLRILNGDGTGTDTVTVRIGDQIVLENVVSPLSYTVNPDCTGTITVVNGPSFDIFIAPDGSEFAEIATAPPGNYPAGIDRRVSRR
jgi:hypothetical protein